MQPAWPCYTLLLKTLLKANDELNSTQQNLVHHPPAQVLHKLPPSQHQLLDE